MEMSSGQPHVYLKRGVNECTWNVWGPLFLHGEVHEEKCELFYKVQGWTPPMHFVLKGNKITTLQVISYFIFPIAFYKIELKILYLISYPSFGNNTLFKHDLIWSHKCERLYISFAYYLSRVFFRDTYLNILVLFQVTKVLAWSKATSMIIDIWICKLIKSMFK